MSCFKICKVRGCNEENQNFILHRAIPVTSVVGYARKKGNSLHRGYNPAMKNKRSDTPKVCWMQHGCDAEDVDMSLKNKTCQPASGAQDSRASLESSSITENK